jgi:hypothetical protein
LTYVRIPLLIFRLKIEIIVENILKICYIKIPINNNVLAIIYIFFIFLYIGGGPVKIYFDIINFGVRSNIVAAVIIKLIIILPSIDSKVF